MKAPGGKAAMTSPEEKTGAAPSVAKLPIDANGRRDWNQSQSRRSG
jgi:hypothetical protein